MPDFSPDTLRAAMVRALDDGMVPESAPSAQEPPKKRGHGAMHAALGVMGGGQVADAITTAQALQRGGTSEANPLYGDHPSLGRVLGTKAALMVPAGFALDKLYDKSPKAALIAALALGGLGMGVAAHNAQQGHK